MATGLATHGVLSFLSGLSISVTGFGCDIARELLSEINGSTEHASKPSAINMGLSAALITAVQVCVNRWLVYSMCRGVSSLPHLSSVLHY